MPVPDLSGAGWSMLALFLVQEVDLAPPLGGDVKGPLALSPPGLGYRAACTWAGCEPSCGPAHRPR